MARIMAKAAVAVALLAIVLQYFGIMPPFPVLVKTFFPSLGRAATQTINAPKLLADLNSDILEASIAATKSTGSSGTGTQDNDQLARASSAALSVMYLASLPGLRDQVKQTPGIVESLVRRLLTLDLAEAHRDIKRQRKQGRRQDQMDLLSAALLATAKVAAGDRPLQDWLLGADGIGDPGGGRSAETRVPRGKMLARLGEVLQSGIPAWQAAAAFLLHSLSGEGVDTPVSSFPAAFQMRPNPVVLNWVVEHAQTLVPIGKSLVEAGAHFKNSDTVLAGSQILQLVASQPRGGRVVLETNLSSLLMQVLVSNAGDNSSSPMVGGAVRLLHRLVAPVSSDAAEDADPGEERKAAAVAQLIRNLTTSGLVAPLVREIRLGQVASLGPSLELLMELIRKDNSGGQEVAREAVGAGALSLCTQLLFQASSDANAHGACCNLVLHMVAHRKASKPPLGSGTPVVDKDDADADGGDVSGEGSGSTTGMVCDRSEEGRMALARELLKIMRQTDFADLHNSVLEACRDVAPSRPAAAALVEAGIIRHLAVILSVNTTKTREEGSYDMSATAWIMQSQRSATALVALLALQGDLRERLMAEGALAGLASALRVHSGRPGIMAQVRITAAAALVPLLGDDRRYLRLAVASGVLEPLLDMHSSGLAQEVTVSARVLRLLALDEAVAEALDNLGVAL
ncbi:hypothetical protein VaNZ11_015388 [Volvox africanus]|uniref:Uncharacterized protein n=1 Tax=Volvox africanus TaxID=51714 RepID=A0ABQ5SLX4_9CHLO|nr:hypothetical protein VaNZ11_015388 [Volvox africanus]